MKLLKILALAAIVTGGGLLLKRQSYKQGAQEACAYFTNPIIAHFGMYAECELVQTADGKKFIIALVNARTKHKVYVDSSTGELVDKEGIPLPAESKEPTDYSDAI